MRLRTKALLGSWFRI